MAVLPTGIGPVTGYNIERSLRFNSADSAYLNRTNGSPTSATTWTLSFWHKRSSGLGTQQNIMGAGQSSGTNYSAIFFTSANQFEFGEIGSVSNLQLTPTQVFRDVSAWYHIIIAVDTTQATASNRIKLYVNGSQITAFTNATYPSQNYATYFNTNAYIKAIGNIWYNGGPGGYYLNGYMTEVNFIDGQALTPSSFGETDSATNVWKPKRYTGTYGTNGFYLNFSDNSGTTSTTLGKDSSGNGNNWTPNNFSVTAGVGNDSMVDSPTSYGTDTGAGGEVRGNYATLNPLSNTAGTYTQGNLRFVGPSSWRRSNGTIAVSTGKWYWEVTLGNAPYSPRSAGTAYNVFGFGLSTVFGSSTSIASVTDAVYLGDDGYYKNFSGLVTNGGVGFSSGDVLAVAVDLDANTFSFYRNNSLLATGTIGGTAGRELVPIIISYDGTYGVMDCNFGQRPFAYTAPSGFKALCTQNLPTPTIGATSTTQAGKYMNAVLYTGNNTYPRSITGFGFQPDLVWQKARQAAWDHTVYDAVRGTGTSKMLATNTTGAEGANSIYANLTSFDSDGFTVGSTSGTNILNDGTLSAVVWAWNAGGSNATNTSGTITSTVRANTTSGFSIVTYTGTNASGNQSVGHGLGVAPKMIIVKSRTTTNGWAIYHSSLGSNAYLFFDTSASGTLSNYWGTGVTSTAFGVYTGGAGGNNVNGANMVAYCFAEVAGYSAFGSYTGNGSTDGPFVFCGFRPRYVLIKNSSAVADWMLFDTVRQTYNVVGNYFRPNTSNAEQSATLIDIVSNGFKIRTDSSSVTLNASNTYIYAAFAESPFKYALAR